MNDEHQNILINKISKIKSDPNIIDATKLSGDFEDEDYFPRNELIKKMIINRFENYLFGWNYI